MIPWKQRMYAFLLRRVLGPLLDPASARQLHESLEVSLQEGKCTLTDISLNTDYVHEKMNKSLPLRIRSVRVRRLHVELSLQEKSSSDDETSSSLAWRALQLGATAATTSFGSDDSAAAANSSAGAAKVSLVVHLELEGVSLEVEPCSGSTAAGDEEEEVAIQTDVTELEAPATSKGILSSYLDAALASLELTVHFKDLSIRLWSRDTAAASANESSTAYDGASWVQLHCQAVSYETVPTASPTPSAEYETTLHKVLQLQQITIMTGTTAANDHLEDVEMKSGSDGRAYRHHHHHRSTTIALLEGETRVSLRMIEYNQQVSPGMNSTKPLRQAQQDIEVTLYQKLNVSVDVSSLVSMHHVVHGFQSAMTATAASSSSSVEQVQQQSHERPDPELVMEHEFAENSNTNITRAEQEDVNVLTSIMNQYQEARRHVERNEYRGGVLIPSFDEDDAEDVTFDAFFDANDASFYHYSTVMRESILVGGAGDASSSSGGASDWVHTKFRFHLQQGGIKVVFPSSNQASNDMMLIGRRQEEYMLLTFDDCNVSSSLSGSSSDHAFSIDRIQVEDSLLVSSTGISLAAVPQVEIGTVLSFSSRNSGMGLDDDEEILLESPCLSVHVVQRKRSSCGDETSTNSLQVELELDPMELTYRPITLQNLSLLCKQVSEGVKSSPVDRGPTEMVENKPAAGEEKSSPLHFSTSCPSLKIILPVVSGHSWDRLYRRCGYSNGLTRSSRSALVVHLEDLAIDVVKKKEDHDESSVSVRNLFVFASTPEARGFLEKKELRFDILALVGRIEGDPISIRVWQNADDAKAVDPNVLPVEATFPKVVPISSFKARQEDDDEDSRVDRILCSRMNGIDVNTRKQLRGSDPQAAMLQKALESDMVVVIQVPEVLCDLTAEEVTLLQDVVSELVVPADNGDEADPPRGQTSRVENAPKEKRMAFVVGCDSLSLAIHEDLPTEQQNINPCSFILKADRMRAHSLINTGKLEQIRFLVQDFHFCEAFGLSRPINLEPVVDSRNRIQLFHQRCSRQEETKTTPILHRSHLFDPISPSSPTILIDLIYPRLNSRDKRNLHVTVYDVTHRYDYDSRDWVQRLKELVSSMAGNAEESEGSGAKDDPPSAVTRVALSLTDCNVDYTSSRRFKTDSRSILRLGDFRVSSNVVSPAAPAQAFSLSLGDVSLYLCNNRFPYHFENYSLVGSKALLDGSERSLGSLTNVSSETILRRMNYRTVLMLDSLDAVLAVSNVEPKQLSDPSFRISFTVGEIGMYVCKDSLARLQSTIGEICAEMTALDDDALEALKARPTTLQGEDGDTFFDTVAEEAQGEDSAHPKYFALDDLKKQSALRPTIGTETSSDRAKDFLLDGYDWTTIDVDESNQLGIPDGEEQAARWFTSEGKTKSAAVADDEEVGFLAGTGAYSGIVGSSYSPRKHRAPRIISHHFPLHPVSDPLVDGDMGAAKYASLATPPSVKARVLVHDLSLKLRCFDGFDWPELLSDECRGLPRKGPFIIDEDPEHLREFKKASTENVATKLGDPDHVASLEKRTKLMGDLLSGSSEPSHTFKDVPLPEEKGRSIKQQAELRRLARRTNKYFQVSASGVSLRLDSFEYSTEHKLVSCLGLKAKDFFVAETISNDRPVKMAGEWVNDHEHPRDTKEGLISLKMVTWRAAIPVNAENEIENDDAQLEVRILPLLCNLDQRAIRFACAFFRGDEEDDDAADDFPAGLHSVPPPVFQSARFLPFKLKVFYTPERIDTKALKDGAVVELINLSPLDGMVLTLQEVVIENEVGFGAVKTILLRRWIEDICATQILKFLTNARPFEPLTTLGGGAADMVILPWDAFQNGDSIQQAIRAGTRSFANALAYETLTMTSRLTEFVATTVSRAASPAAATAATVTTTNTTTTNRMLPSRPLHVPRTVQDASQHAVESLSRGLQTASYRVVIVPYREYHRRGATGAASSIVRGIPVAIAAPASGAAEALSFALLGARNQMRPDIRREEEASQRGLHLDY